MKKQDAEEAIPILERTMQQLLASVQDHGRSGFDVRRAIGKLLARANEYLRSDTAGQPIADCFEVARVAKVTAPQFEAVRLITTAEAPVTLGGILTKQSLIAFCLSVQCRVIADAIFDSRQDADIARTALNSSFAAAEESAADDMDAMSFQALISLHGAIIFHLLEKARPLPRLVRYRFARPLSTLVMSYRLYDDASRADELKNENRIVHPAFAPREGLALSA
jgi:prophage DNA circulation protein